jgi:hypothetical protein
MWGRVWGYPKSARKQAIVLEKKFERIHKEIPFHHSTSFRRVTTTVLRKNHGLFCSRGSTIFNQLFVELTTIFCYTIYDSPYILLMLPKLKQKKNPAAVALGKLGGLVGGKARAKKLSARRRSEIARNAVLARWQKYRNEK